MLFPFCCGRPTIVETPIMADKVARDQGALVGLVGGELNTPGHLGGSHSGLGVIRSARDQGAKREQCR